MFGPRKMLRLPHHILVLAGLWAVILNSRGAADDGTWEIPLLAPPLAAGFAQHLTPFRGNLYASGFFWKAGGVGATNLARWDGTNWWPVLFLGESIPDSMAASSSSLFLAGQFWLPGRTNVARLIRWDGTNHTVFEEAPAWWIQSIAVIGSDLYVGGYLTNIAGVDVNGIARWDGTNWFPLASGVEGQVRSMAAQGKDLFVSGTFVSAGGIAATNIARWDGTNWWPLGAGVGDAFGSVWVRSMLATERGLYIAGNFQTAGGKAITNMARWDGTNWSSLRVNPRSSVSALAYKGGVLHAAGRFESIGGIRATNLAQWNGTNWARTSGSPWGPDFTELTALTVWRGALHVSGPFDRAGNKRVNGIARWDGGNNWSGLGDGLIGGGGFGGSAVLGNKLYVGGHFQGLGGIRASNVACWNGTYWSPLRKGTDDPVNAMVALGNQLYVGGSFLNVNGLPARRVARWDGTNWFALGNGVDFSPSAMTVFSNKVVAGGRAAGAAVTNPVARWTGTNWSRLVSANGRIILRQVDALAANSNRLFALADVTDNGTNKRAVVQWNGRNWSTLGSFYESDNLQALTVYQNRLYVAGVFDYRYALAEWTGTNWLFTAPLGDLFSSGIRNVAVLGGDVFVCGNGFTLTIPDGQTLRSGIARWDGLEWSLPAGGPEALVFRMVAKGTNLYASGAFAYTGGRESAGLAIWHQSPPQPELRISRSGDNLQISWPRALTNHALQTQAALGGNDWQQFEKSTVSIGSRNVVTNSSKGASTFFRLKVK